MHNDFHICPKGFLRYEQKSFDVSIKENFKKCDPRDIANLLHLSGKISRINDVTKIYCSYCNLNCGAYTFAVAIHGDSIRDLWSPMF